MTDADTAIPSTPARGAEPSVALPTRRLLVAVIGACLGVAALWSGVIALGPWGREVLLAGPLGALPVLVAGAGGVLAMTPWKTRTMTDWWTMWLGAMVLRLLVTPALGFLLYSAAPLSPEALCLAIAATYLAALMAEAAVITQHVNRSLLPS